VAASQLMAATRLLTTFAMPRPMPTAIAHPRALINENPLLVGSNGEGAVASLRTNWYPALSNFLASSPHNVPMQADKSFHIRSRVTSEVYLLVILVVGGARIHRPRLSFTRAEADVRPTSSDRRARLRQIDGTGHVRSCSSEASAPLSNPDFQSPVVKNFGGVVARRLLRRARLDRAGGIEGGLPTVSYGSTWPEVDVLCRPPSQEEVHKCLPRRRRSSVRKGSHQGPSGAKMAPRALE
jgi:hypothetical protein